MIQIIWEFHVQPDKKAEFERYYGAEGQWARLFGQSPAYQGTTLACDMDLPERYLVTDVWTDLAAFHEFKQSFQAEYEQLDRLGEQFTKEERYVGVFLLR